MRLCAVVDRKFAKNPGNVKDDDYKVKFLQVRKLTEEEEKLMDEAAKAAWLGNTSGGVVDEATGKPIIEHKRISRAEALARTRFDD